jgi:type IV pilus assembly protein PilX
MTIVTRKNEMFSFIAQTSAPKRQRGVVLMVALIVLVAMALAGIAMVRSMGTGLGIAGNIAFRQNATSVGDIGISAAFNQVLSQTETARNNNIPTLAYSATWDPAFNYLTYNWDGNSLEATADDGTRNRVRVVVHRLCELTGPATGSAILPGQRCVVDVVRLVEDQRTPNQNPSFSEILLRPAYRITARIDGPRETRSFVQVIAY